MGLILQLFITFFKIGLFTFGGGYAMISIIENNCVEKKKWITDEEMMNMTAIAESTPGPIAINCSTYVGYKQKGLPGALAATFGMVLPSFIIILLIAAFLDNFLDITVIANAFKGIKIAVGILIVDAAVKMIKKSEKSVKMYAFFIASTLVMLASSIFALNFSTIVLIVSAAVVAIIIECIRKAGKNDIS